LLANNREKAQQAIFSAPNSRFCEES